MGEVEQLAEVEVFGPNAGSHTLGIAHIAFLLYVHRYHEGGLTHIECLAHRLKPTC